MLLDIVFLHDGHIASCESVEVDDEAASLRKVNLTGTRFFKLHRTETSAPHPPSPS